MPSDANAHLALGIDIGGTNIRAALVTPHGNIIDRAHRPTPHNADGDLPAPDELTRAVVDCAAPLLASATVLAVGVGSGGQFDPSAGVFRGTNTHRADYIGYPLRDRLAAVWGLPVFVDNDVKMAAYGELIHGAGRGIAHMLVVAVGTGIGGAVIIDGALYHGRSGLAGHLGQIPHAPNGETVEHIAGGVWMGRRAVAAGLLSADETTADLFAHARNGNAHAAQFIAESAAVLGRALAGLVHTFEPQRVLLGGSVGVQPEYHAATDTALRAHLMPAWADVPLTPATLGPDAGLIGAATFAHHHQ